MLLIWLAAFALSGVITNVNSRNTYVALVPQIIRPGLVSFVHINIFRGFGIVHLRTNLRDSGFNVISTTRGAMHIPGATRLPLRIPRNITTRGNYSIEVRATGAALFKNYTRVQVNLKATAIFIQTDKATYRPGDLVRFRAFGIYPDLKPVLKKMDVVIFDSKRNRLKQWIGVTPPFGILEGSIKLTKFPNIGDWRIQVDQEGNTQTKTFRVEEYVLPKFEVTLKFPFLVASNDYFTGEIIATYTFGKPVTGRVSMTIRRTDGTTFTKNFPITGRAKFRILMREVSSSRFGGSVRVDAAVTESVTGITRKAQQYVRIWYREERMEFLSSASNVFKPRLEYKTILLVTRGDGSPLLAPGGQVNVTITYTLPPPRERQSPAGSLIAPPRPPISTPQMVTFSSRLYKIPKSGMITIRFNHRRRKIPGRAIRVNINAYYRGTSAGAYLRRAYSKYNSYILVQVLTRKPMAGQMTVFRIISTRRIRTFYYQVISKGVILQMGRIRLDHFRYRRRFRLTLTAAAAPRAQVLVYYIRRGEIVADSVSFSLAGVFSNRVAIGFRHKESKPGSSNALRLRSDPGSLVNVLAIDKSVQLLRSGNDITRDDVLTELQRFDTRIFSPWSWSWRFPIGIGGIDADSVFREVGVKVLTDAILYRHIVPPIFVPFRRFGGTTTTSMPVGIGTTNTPAVLPQATVSVPSTAEGGQDKSLAEPERTRTLFPETLLFQNLNVEDNGRGVIRFTVPDQITTFVASAFSMNLESGLGVVAQTANMTVFQRFFIRINPTPSAIRGEVVIKQVDIFNYGDHDEEVTVEFRKGKFSFADMRGNPFTPPSGNSWIKKVFVKHDSVVPVFFPFIPDVIGKIKIHVIARTPNVADAVIREMDVKPEGVQRRYYIPILKDLTNVGFASTKVDILFPPGLVVGSEYIKITAIGDLMGSTVAGIEDLLRMSYGCGEQNMINFAPNVFVTDYLKATNRLTKEIEDKAKDLLAAGYQRELRYKRDDGSFSAFGQNDRSGTIWLTSFVLKSFVQAKDIILIDNTVVKDAIIWILRYQNANGSFREPGIVFHKAMQGGSIANIRSLTAYIVIALQEAKDQGYIPPVGSGATAIRRGADFLAQGLPGDINTLYELAIITYALRVTNHSQAQTALNILETQATTREGMKYWIIPPNQADSILPFKSWSPPSRQVRALDIEATAYALLTYVRNRDTANGIRVLKWLATQRNDQGGFISTQDTVLAIQAFSEFSALAFSPNFNIITTVRSLGQDGFQHTFTINNQNAIVLQRVEAPRTVRELNISAVGQGICLTEVAVFFNVEEDLMEPAFSLNVSLTNETINGFKIHICFRWLRGGQSTMALLEIGIPTGMEGVISTLSKVGIPEIKRVEEGFRKVDVYMDSVSSEAKCTSMDVQRVDLISRHKAVPVILSDYYETTNQVTVFYESSVLKNATVVEVCSRNGCVDVKK